MPSFQKRASNTLDIRKGPQKKNVARINLALNSVLELVKVKERNSKSPTILRLTFLEIGGVRESREEKTSVP